MQIRARLHILNPAMVSHINEPLRVGNDNRLPLLADDLCRENNPFRGMSFFATSKMVTGVGASKGKNPVRGRVGKAAFTAGWQVMAIDLFSGWKVGEGTR